MHFHEYLHMFMNIYTFLWIFIHCRWEAVYLWPVFVLCSDKRESPDSHWEGAWASHLCLLEVRLEWCEPSSALATQPKETQTATRIPLHQVQKGLQQVWTQNLYYCYFIIIIMIGKFCYWFYLSYYITFILLIISMFYYYWFYFYYYFSYYYWYYCNFFTWST